MFVLTLILHIAVAGGFNHHWTVIIPELSNGGQCEERASEIEAHAARRVGHFGKVTAEIKSCEIVDGWRI